MLCKNSLLYIRSSLPDGFVLLRYFFLVIFSILFLNLNVAVAMEIRIVGYPNDYSIYSWLPSDVKPEKIVSDKTSAFYEITVNIPDQYIVKTRLGKVDFLASLDLWRRKSPRGSEHPYTRGDGIGLFPIDVYYKNVDYIGGASKRYVALPHILKRIDKYPDLQFSSTSGEVVSIERTGLVDELLKIKASGGPVNCNKATFYNSPANWTTSECMLCNCANEAGIKNNAGKLAVTQVVLRRVVSKFFKPLRQYGRSICGAVLSRTKTGAAFSWTLLESLQTHDRMPTPGHPGTKKVLRDCVDTSIEAIAKGPGKWDHYLNRAEANPNWDSKYLEIGKEGAHTFLRKLRTDNTYADALQKELGSTRSIVRPIDNMGFTEEEIRGGALERARSVGM